MLLRSRLPLHFDRGNIFVVFKKDKKFGIVLASIQKKLLANIIVKSTLTSFCYVFFNVIFQCLAFKKDCI